MLTQAVLVAIVSIVVAFLLAAAEAALYRMSRVRAEELYDEGRVGSAALVAVVADPTAYLSVLTFLRVAAEATTAVLVTLAVVELVDSGAKALAISVAIMAVVSFVVVGVSPRTLGRANYDRVALVAAPLTRGLRRALGPVAKALVAFGDAVTPGKGYLDGPFRTESELRDLLEQASDRDVIEDDEAEMLDSVFELGQTRVREVMVPRPDMVTVGIDATAEAALAILSQSGHSRLPVVGTDSDDIHGLLYLKDVVARVLAEPSTAGRGPAAARLRVAELMRPMTFVPDSKPADDLLREMQRDQIHLAIVIDEYGGTAGLITIEDILEEIVGEIADEHDPAEPGIERLPDGSVRVPAALHVDDLADVFDIEIDEDEIDTVGGLLTKVLGRLPYAGATVIASGLELTAERMAHRHRIATVMVRWAPKEDRDG